MNQRFHGLAPSLLSLSREGTLKPVQVLRQGIEPHAVRAVPRRNLASSSPFTSCRFKRNFVPKQQIQLAA